mmetsp:Transcript_22506/g.63184  ORF Transcript_22506/g.63184 Transcript_22506/m.63184 type:complete len:442 (-) Transcript_22506:661-1986(-)
MKHTKGMVVGILVLGSMMGVESLDLDFPDVELRRVAFGSCNKPNRPTEVWESLEKLDPDLFIWLGDAIYSDSHVVPSFHIPGTPQMQREYYAAQRAIPAYERLLRRTAVTGVWDDHDMGVDDSGSGFRFKVSAQQNFLAFLEEPLRSPRWTRDGVYVSVGYGPPGRRVTLILVDVRYHREFEDVLGDAQWAWLERELAEAFATSQVILLGSGSQVLAVEKPLTEAFCLADRRRLLGLVQGLADDVAAARGDAAVPRFLLLSGDVHYAELMEMYCPLNTAIGEEGRGSFFRVVEATSSGLTHSMSEMFGYGVAGNIISAFLEAHRVPGYHHGNRNFGVIDIGWAAEGKVPPLSVRIHNETGSSVLHHTLSEQVVRLADVTAPADGRCVGEPQRIPLYCELSLASGYINLRDILVAAALVPLSLLLLLTMAWNVLREVIRGSP